MNCYGGFINVSDSQVVRSTYFSNQGGVFYNNVTTETSTKATFLTDCGW